jgi:hypothetical protein
LHPRRSGWEWMRGVQDRRLRPLGHPPSVASSQVRQSCNQPADVPGLADRCGFSSQTALDPPRWRGSANCATLRSRGSDPPLVPPTSGFDNGLLPAAPLRHPCVVGRPNGAREVAGATPHRRAVRGRARRSGRRSPHYSAVTSPDMPQVRPRQLMPLRELRPKRTRGYYPSVSQVGMSRPWG